MCRRQLIKAIILAGSHDFGRCALASRLPTALWPVAGKPVLENLLSSLANQGIKKVTICSSRVGSLLKESIHVDNRLELNFLDESLPVGAAGCIRDAAVDKTDALGSRKARILLIFPASIMCPPKIDVLVNAHRDGQSDVLQKMIETIQKDYPGIAIAGYRDGYFDKDEEQDVAKNIKDSRADILFVGVSSPKKENFLKN